MDVVDIESEKSLPSVDVRRLIVTADNLISAIVNSDHCSATNNGYSRRAITCLGRSPFSIHSIINTVFTLVNPSFMLYGLFSVDWRKTMRIIKRQEIRVEGLVERIQKDMESDQRPIAAICGEAGFSYQNWRRIATMKCPSMDENTFRALESVLGKDYGVTFLLIND